MFNRLKVLGRKVCTHVPPLRPLLGMPMQVTFIRHGESVHNAILEGRLFLETKEEQASVGQNPDHRVELSEEGKFQAQKTGGFIRGRFGIPDAIVHSGYVRTKQTTQGILKAYPDVRIPTVEDRRWRERESGHTYLILDADRKQFFAYMDRYWKIVGPFFARPAGGESLADVVEQRVTFAFQDLCKNYAGKRVFVVAHGRTIQCARIHIEHMTIEQAEAFLKEPGPNNCSMTTYVYSPELGKLVFLEYVMTTESASLNV